MRVWGWIVAFVIVAAIGAAAVYVVTSGPPPARPQAVSSATSPAEPMLTRGVRGFDASYHRHRQAFRDVSDYSQRVRTNRIVAVVGFLVFVLLTLPKNARGVAAFYRQMMEKAPLPAATGASDDNNRRARKVLFFYLLFLLYQLVQFPLTWGRDNAVQFYSDLAIQAFLFLAVAFAFHGLKRGIREQWEADPDRQAKMKAWLGTRLDGIAIRWRDITKMAVGVFVAAFTPALLAQLTNWLDAFAAFNQRMVGP